MKPFFETQNVLENDEIEKLSHLYFTHSPACSPKRLQLLNKRPNRSGNCVWDDVFKYLFKLNKQCVIFCIQLISARFVQVRTQVINGESKSHRATTSVLISSAQPNYFSQVSSSTGQAYEYTSHHFR